MSAAVVVGGGVAGLLAARLLRDRFERVCLVEKDAACGGLLGSIVNEDGVSFDLGAHLLSDTGVPAIDDLLYGWLDPADWHAFHVLRAGNYFSGAMNRDSPFPDARGLGPDAFRKGMRELRATRSGTPGESDLQSILEHRFGATFANGVIAPALRKQLGAGPAELHPDTPFVLRRIVCGDAAESRALKEDPALAEVVAYASYEEGVGTALHRYPRKGGIGQWIEGFVRQMEGVEFITGRTVARVVHANGVVGAVELDDGRGLPCDLLVWTIPSAMLLRAASVPFESRPPAQRPIGLFHLVFDRPFADPNYHVTCYDEDRAMFRTTLYPALRGAPEAAPFNCTVEVIGGPGTDFAAQLDAVVAELADVGITAPGARLLSSQVQVVPMGFPATTHAFMQAAADQARLAGEHLRNALLLGRAKCPPFFTSDVLADVYQRLGDGAAAAAEG